MNDLSPGLAYRPATTSSDTSTSATREVLTTKRRPIVRKSFDWLLSPENHKLTPYQQFVLDVDKHQCPLGPIVSWPDQLRQCVLAVVAQPNPTVVFWGDESIIFYNEAYTTLIGKKHGPALFGQDPRIELAELWTYCEEMITRSTETGSVQVETNVRLELERYGYLEEAYFTSTWAPVLDASGYVVGCHVGVVETSLQVVSNRRMALLQDLTAGLLPGDEVADICAKSIKTLEGDIGDISVALLYSICDADDVSASEDVSKPANKETLPGTVSYKLEAATAGLPESTRFAPRTVHLGDESTDCWLASAFRQSRVNPSSILSDTRDGKIPAHVLEGISCRESGVPITQFVVSPCYSTSIQDTIAFAVIGLSPRKLCDTEYTTFIKTLTQQIFAPLRTAMEETSLRLYFARQRDDALAKAALARELSTRTKEFEQSQMKFVLFANSAQIGMGIFNPSGTVQYANEIWHSLTGLPLYCSRESWADSVVSDDMDLVNENFNKVVETLNPVRFLFRFKKRWKSPDVDETEQPIYTYIHVICNLHPDLDANGSLRGLMSCLTDVSELKYVESELRKKMDQAILMRKRHENFIDRTSHEIRNPLAAIIASADSIVSTLEPYCSTLCETTTNRMFTIPGIKIKDSVNAANTVVYCALHQKRIVDDILTLSRLDSDLLHMVPEPSQPKRLVQNVMSMFERELKRADIKAQLIEEKSLKQTALDWVMIDSTRVVQVLINLITNSIKFTRSCPRRELSISIGATSSEPFVNDCSSMFTPKSGTSRDQTLTADWGDGQIIYLSVSVKDSGCGMTQQESQTLFSQFQQASPKTSVQYGGSGLGLFISRQMVEMHGGRIGVSSVIGHGSNFTFYVKTRRTDGIASSGEVAVLPMKLPDDAIQEACGQDPPIAWNDSESQSLQLGKDVAKTDTIHILVVEDNLINQKVLSKQLRSFGCAVHVANHGQEALDFLEKTEWWLTSKDRQKLSVILMDHEMPVMNGITAVKRIREYEAAGKIRGHVPVIALTANARDEQLLEARAAGMDDIITKPYRIGEVMVKLRALKG